MSKDYSDIINLPHHTSPNRPRMSLRNRSAQFAPFSALSGYEESILEEGRVTKKKPELSEETKTILNEKLRYLNENKGIEAQFIYFVKDAKKEGGSFASKIGVIKRLDEVEGVLILTDKTKIKFTDLLDIKSDVFDSFEME